VLVPLLAWAQVGLVLQKAIPPSLAAYGAGFGTLLLVAHLVVRRFAPYADPVLLPVVAVLNGLGLVMIHRLDLARPGGTDSAPSQLVWTAVGIVAFVVVLVAVRDHRTLQRYTYTAMLLGLVLLVLPLVPGLGVTINGARIWIRAAGFSFQPGEIAKLVLIVFFAGYLVVKRDVLALASKRVLGIDLPRGRDLGPILVAWAVSLAVLVFERDLGTSVLFFGAFVALLYIATERRSWLIIGVLLVLGGGYAAYNFFAHVRRRIDIWIDPFADPTDASFQLVQGLFGFASGGILGNGLAQGRPDLVPFAKTDFIVAALGEELGLTGLMAIMLLYGILVERGLRTAIAARDAFGKLLAAGLSVIFALQVFVVVGGVTRLIPLTGLTTPFLSYGGSSLVANYALIALLLRISDGARRPAPPSEPVPVDGDPVAMAVPDDAPTQVVRR
jgi:cell division protein FtsW (lipid II flippase)